MDIAGKIDHTLLRADCLERDIIVLCEEAIVHSFYSVCVPPFYVTTAAGLLKKSNVKICTVIGFPFGYHSISSKVEEASEAIQSGVHEVDMVINISAFKSGKILQIYSEVEKMAELVHKENIFLKVIIETAYLNQDEIRMLCGICVDAGADFIKTSTGYAPHGASVDDVIFIKSIIPERIKIKASGGIKTYKQAFELLSNGADRLGTSNGVQIVNMMCVNSETLVTNY